MDQVVAQLLRYLFESVLPAWCGHALVAAGGIFLLALAAGRPRGIARGEQVRRYLHVAGEIPGRLMLVAVGLLGVSPLLPLDGEAWATPLLWGIGLLFAPSFLWMLARMVYLSFRRDD